MAASLRQQKFARFLQRELGDIFQRDKRGILDNAFVTIADVTVSADLGVAKVYISMMLAGKDKEQLLERLNRGKGEIRRALGDRIRKQVRVIPELIFIIDETEERAFRIEEIIKNLHIPPADKESE